MELTVGNKAPAFSLKDASGKLHKLSDYLGQWVVLYFYPKDNTPGCTVEACAFKKNNTQYKKLKAVVLGVSKDSVESHDSFLKKYKLNFALLSDPEAKVIQAYGVWKEKSMFGKTFMGIKRMSYLIDPKGKVAKVYKTVKPAEHADQVIKDLQKLQ